MNIEQRTMNYGKNNESKKDLPRCSMFIVHNSILGFTLIELLVVISILGILTTLLISNVSGVRERARDSQRKSDLYEIKQALKMYHNDYDTYPSASAGAIVGCGDPGPSACEWGKEFTRGETSYMKVLPEDPQSSATNPLHHVYEEVKVDGVVDQDDFKLYAILENVSDQDIAKSQTRCGGSVANAYYVCAD